MKRGQINMFIIAGVVIIIIIALLFFYQGVLNPDLETGKKTNPDSFLESCIEEKIKEAVSIMLPQGGYIEPELKIRFKFEGQGYEEIPYLCYTSNYYVSCVNQEPMLIKHLNEEIKNYLGSEVKNCFDSYGSELAKENFEIDSSYEGFDVELIPEKILVNIYGKLIFTKTGETFKQEDFEVRVATQLYDLAVVAQEILSQEAEYCHFDQVGFMLLNPKFELDKFKTGDSTIIYEVKHRDSEEEFQFAVRSCVIPAGM